MSGAPVTNPIAGDVEFGKGMMGLSASSSSSSPSSSPSSSAAASSPPSSAHSTKIDVAAGRNGEGKHPAKKAEGKQQRLKGVADAKRWAGHVHQTIKLIKPPHRPPQLIQRLVDLRSALQAHRAEFDQAVDLVKAAWREADASDATRKDAETIKALLSDIAEETELISRKHDTVAAEETGSVLQLNFKAQKRQQRLRLANYTETAAELFNEAGDIYFLTVLWAKAAWLFVISAALLTANMLGRLWVIHTELAEVEEGKRKLFWRGAAVFMVEPNSGMRMMKKALKDKGVGGTAFDAATRTYVHLDKDAVAVAAENDLVAGRAEVQTIGLMMGTEDVPQLVLQLLFLVIVEQGAPDTAFWLALVGTIIHLAQRGKEALVTRSNLERLKQVAEGRDKVFEEYTTDDVVAAFAEECGVEVRSISLRRCNDITDASVSKVGKCCPNLTTLDLNGHGCRQLTALGLNGCRVTDAGLSKVGEGCWQLTVLDLTECSAVTDAGVSKVAKGCRQLTTLHLSRCSAVTDAGVSKVAEGCRQLTALYLDGCSAVTDAGVSKVGEGCRQLTALWLNGCRVTDAGLSKVGEGCSQLTALNLRGCSVVTDVGVSKVAKGCPQLMVLDLYGCSAVTDAGVSKVSESCTQLTTLHLSGCLKVAKSAIVHLCSTRPECEVIGFVDYAANQAAEVADASSQTTNNGPRALTRLRGIVGSGLRVSIDNVVKFGTDFDTLGAPGLVVTDGVAFYELEILSLKGIRSYPQFGWAAGGFERAVGALSNKGVGDDTCSWGVDGENVKACGYGGGKDYGQAWQEGDIIGLAANLDTGAISFGLNNSWEPPMGIAFDGVQASGGIYPALSGGALGRDRFGVDDDAELCVRVNLGSEPWRYGPPPESEWRS
eukprot:COSAG01_NODE_2948_length_6807_cov_38.353555_3_plen_886_part_00